MEDHIPIRSDRSLLLGRQTSYNGLKGMWSSMKIIINISENVAVDKSDKSDIKLMIKI